MSNMLDYLLWRGDLPFSSDPVNEVDCLILSRISYIPWDSIVPEDFSPGITGAEASARFLSLPDAAEKVMNPEDLRLLDAVFVSERFRTIRLCGYVSRFDTERQEQFSAVTLELEPGVFCIAYRGTDNSLLGWKEDFNMGFHFPVPAQADSLRYFVQAAESLPGKFYLAGHSKGGNLSVYAACFCEPHLQERILHVYNFDGPGFMSGVMDERYLAVCERTSTYIPQSSIVGMLLDHEEDYTIIHSTQHGFQQHDLYSWEICGRHFACLGEQLSGGSRIFDRTLKDWCRSLNDEELEQFFDTLYQLLSLSEAETLSGIAGGLLHNSRIVKETLREMSPEMRKLMSECIRCLAKCAAHNVNLETAALAPKKAADKQLPQ